MSRIKKDMMIENTIKNSTGTGFHNSFFNGKKSQLIELLGIPKYTNSGDNKITTEWVKEIDGDVFTIYDWKYYREIQNDEIIQWNIGGKSKSITEKVKTEILKFIN